MKIIIILTTLFLISLPCSASPKSSSPNIVLIIADDVSAEDVGCYGCPGIKTPVMDRLAATGIRFDNGFVTTATCAASRGSIMLGRWPHCTAMPELKAIYRPEIKEIETFVERLDSMVKSLHENGYYTIQRGKWHIGGAYPFNNPKGIFRKSFDTVKAGNPRLGGEEDWVSALQQRPKNKPFFCWFASYDAHRKFTAPKVHLESDVKVPPYMPDLSPKKGYRSRADLAKYYDEINRLDTSIGNVVKELKAQEVYENTIIVIIADNGRPFVRSKLYTYDSGMRVPFIIHWKGGIKQAGTVSKSLVSTIDLAPTFLEAAGITIEGTTFQGRSLIPLLQEDSSAANHPFIVTERNHHIWEAHERAIRTAEFLYIRNRRPEIQRRGADWADDSCMWHLRKELSGAPMPQEYTYFFTPALPEELFNVKKDPHQLKNIIENKENEPVLQKMRRYLSEWEKQTRDTAPKKLTRHIWNDKKWGYPKDKKAFNPESNKLGDQPGWNHLKNSSDEQLREEAAYSRKNF